MGLDIQPQIVGRFRAGDIRHCYADISRITTTLGYAPRITFEEGMADLVKWVSEQEATDLVDQARAELEARRLIK
jgi:dTDP-L-rhamnose 4-epimerase